MRDSQTGYEVGEDSYSELKVFGCNPDLEDPILPFTQDGTSLGVLQGSVADAPGFAEIVWSSAYYAGVLDTVLPADPRRCILIVEKVDASTNPVAVNFGGQAQGFGSSVTGLQLFNQGSSLYVDEKCPTNDVHINTLPVVGAPSQAVVVIGTRGKPLQPLPPSVFGMAEPGPVFHIPHPVTGQPVAVTPTSAPVSPAAAIKKFFSNFSAGG